MSTIPRANRAVTDPDRTARRRAAEQLLDMTRQWAYSQVTRRANLKRHLDACGKCKAPDAEGQGGRSCGQARELAGKVAECHNSLVELREQLAELDRPDPAPVAASAATMF